MQVLIMTMNGGLSNMHYSIADCSRPSDEVAQAVLEPVEET